MFLWRNPVTILMGLIYLFFHNELLTKWDCVFWLMRGRGGLLLQEIPPLAPPNELEGKVDRIFQYSFFLNKVVQWCLLLTLVIHEKPLEQLFTNFASSKIVMTNKSTSLRDLVVSVKWMIYPRAWFSASWYLPHLEKDNRKKNLKGQFLVC